MDKVAFETGEYIGSLMFKQQIVISQTCEWNQILPNLSNLSWIESDVESHISAARDSVLLKPGLTDNAVKIKC